MKKEKEKKKKHEKRALQSEPVIQKAKNEPSAAENPLKLVTNIIGGKWKIHVLWALREQKGKRYSEIKSDIPNITDMMLSQSLRELVANELVERKQFQEIPPRVEYQMTASGAELLPALTLLADWGAKRLNMQIKK